MRQSNKTSKKLVLWLQIALAIASSPGQALSTPQTSNALRFDTKWWRHADSQEHQGFIYGYLDCQPSRKVAKASIIDYEKAVADALRTGNTGDPNTVVKAIRHAAQTLTARDTRGAEDYAEPHGFLDGEWWGDFRGPRPSEVASNDKGYVEGYLSCGSAPVSSEKVARYQADINRHYASGQHDRDKIAVVLERLRKRPSNTQK